MNKLNDEFRVRHRWLYRCVAALTVMIAAANVSLAQGSVHVDIEQKNATLAEVFERCSVAGLEVLHVDITVVAQTPRIAPFRANIADNVAKLLHLPVGRVNVKATTEEKLGFTGEKKGIKVMAVVTGTRPATI